MSGLAKECFPISVSCLYSHPVMYVDLDALKVVMIHILMVIQKLERGTLQGLVQAWNFNQPEALRAFQLAQREDPDAAMVYWGQAYAQGPGANRQASSLDRPADVSRAVLISWCTSFL